MKRNGLATGLCARLLAGGVGAFLMAGGAAPQQPPMPPRPAQPREAAAEAGEQAVPPPDAQGAAEEGDALIRTAQELLARLQEEPERVVPLSLEQSIRLAVENNFDVHIESVAPLQADAGVARAESEFDPFVAGGGAGGALMSVSQSQATSAALDPDPPTHHGASSGLMVGQPLQTGGLLSLGYAAGYAKSDPAAPNFRGSYWTSETYVSLSHPLLRGAGLASNLANIRVARNNREISHEGFRSQLIGVLFGVESAYWNLVRAREELRVALKSLQVALDNRHSSLLQWRAGTQPRLEVTTADAGVADRLSRVYQAEVNVRDREDALKHEINLPQDWHLEDISIRPLNRPDEDVGETVKGLDLSQAIAVALQCRPEVRQTELDIRSNQIIENRRRNERLPSLNAELELAYSGLSGNHENAARDMGRGQGHRQSAAVKFHYPLGNRAANAQLRTARLATRRARLEQERIRQIIVVRVRSALRRIKTDRQRVVASRKAQELHAERLEAEQRRKEVGRATSFNVLQVEEDYVAAQRDYLNALIDYQISVVNLDSELGTLLDLRGIEIGDVIAEAAHGG